MLRYSTGELDYLSLIKAARRLPPNGSGPRLKLALLADFAPQQLATLLRVLFHKNGIELELLEADYDTIELQAFDPGSALYQFQPDFIVCGHGTGKLRASYYGHGPDKTGFAHAYVDKITGIWDAIGQRTDVPVIQANLAIPLERTFGSFDLKVPGSLRSVACDVNALLTERARQRKNVFPLDVEFIASFVGKATWFDEKLWTLAKGLCALDHLPLVAQAIVDIVLAARGATVKCVVVDLDNTLWGGVIGDDGVEGIRLGHLGEGEAFLNLQLFLRELKNRGILLAVCSKNDHANAIAPFRDHPEMVLRLEDLAAFVANWDNKADNLRRIQSQLNIGFDSMVFLDDNAFERNLVRQFLPEVIVPELPEDPADYVKALAELNLFETTTFSALDLQRTELYRADAQRDQERVAFASLDDYLGSLQMTATVERFSRFQLPRIAQLIQRSNQFNLTTRRYTEAQCEEFMRDDSGVHPFWISLRDKFGDNGLILVAIARLAPEELEIDTFLMSCRVLQRGVEQLAMNRIVEIARTHGLPRLVGRYVPTAKNGMVKEFYAQFGFRQVSESAEGMTEWHLDVQAYQPIPVHIAVESAAAASEGLRVSHG